MSPAQTFAKMQTRVFNACQAFTSLEVDPPTFGHTNAYDQCTAYWTSPPEDALFLLPRPTRSAQPPRTETVRPVDSRRVCALR